MSVADDVKKRKIDHTQIADGDTEQRKKRKRTSHSKKKKPEDDTSDTKPKPIPQPQGATLISAGQVGDPVESNENHSDNGNKLPSDPLNTANGKSRPAEDVSEKSSSELTKKKAKKIKRKEKETTSKMSTETDNVEVEEPITDSKSEAAQDKYPNPKKDNSLTGSTYKALMYVYERLSSRSEWKFNKARQNWLLRNIWDDKAIPELYFASCLKYLKGVQGNSRVVLVKECNSILEERSQTILKDSTEKEKTVRFQEPPKEQGDDVKLLRARMIFKKLEKKK